MGARPLIRFRQVLTGLLLAAGSFANAVVPTYEMEIIDEFNIATIVWSANNNGMVVGTQIVAGVQRGFIASESTGITLLPLPAGYLSSEAFDINDNGLIVGTAATSSLAADFGEPAVWLVNEEGGYSAIIPEQFETLPGPVGELQITGGQIVAVNNSDDLIGWSRYQGFQGGPATRFFLSEAPVNLGALGMQATPRDVNDAGVVVGDQLKFDLTDNSVTDIGVPPDLSTGTPFTNAIVYAINNAGETVVAANLASVPTENYLTYRHSEGVGYQRLNPAQLPSRFVGFYDNNDPGDVLASGGIFFKAEDQLITSVEQLLAPPFGSWSISGGIITNDRSVYATATNPSTGQNALVVLKALSEDFIFSTSFEIGS